MKFLVIKYVIVFLLLLTYAYGQESLLDPRPASANDNQEHNSVLRLQKETKANFSESKTDLPDERVTMELREFSKNLFVPVKQISYPAPGLVNSFRNNVHFGGFWDKYCIINFTPNMYIQPTDFISIFATHNTSVYVPIKGATEYAKSLALQSLAIVAIDNSMKFLLPPNNVIQGIVSFALKNAAMALVKKFSSENTLTEFKYYYYSVSIRF
jgi:hypothetical protein